MSSPRPQAPDGLAAQADLVAATALAVPGVVGLHGGALGEVAVYLPGRRVSGVRLRDGRTQVHVVLALGVPVRATAETVQRAVAAVRPGPVDVTVEDVADPTQPAVGA
ncbi:hypothetical protein [Jannaschia sp. R86511]|uniref:hypothetical protein n=1 Tax=Jannaschia sp. R86511 TaxID=3093853 RepID=UPI0036D31667